MYSNGVVGKKHANYSNDRNQRDYGMLVEGIGHPPLAKLPIHKILLRQKIMPFVISGKKKGNFLFKNIKARNRPTSLALKKRKQDKNRYTRVRCNL